MKSHFKSNDANLVIYYPYYIPTKKNSRKIASILSVRVYIAKNQYFPQGRIQQKKILRKSYAMPSIIIYVVCS